MQILTIVAVIFYQLEQLDDTFPLLLIQLMQLIVGILYLLFAILISNVLVIPTYEFLSFNFLKYKNPLIHLSTFSYINNRDKQFNSKTIKEKSYVYINIFLIAIGLFYIIGFFCGLFSNMILIKHLAEFLILTFVYIYYLIIFFCYILISIYTIYKNPLNFKPKVLPDINLLSYSLNPIYYDNYEKNCEEKQETQSKEKFWDIRNFIRIGLNAIFALIVIFINIKTITYNKKNNKKISFLDVLSLIINVLFTGSIFSLSIVLNFPFCFKNQIDSKLSLKKEAKPKHPFMLPIIRIICFILSTFISSILVIAFFLMEEQNGDYIDLDVFSNIPKKKMKSNSLLPNICNSFIYNIPIYLYIPFMNDAYYYNESNRFSSFKIPNYRKIFFDKEYVIEVKGNIIEGDDKVKMVRYDIKNGKKNVNVTILAIKGTSNKKDVYMDFQLFMPSVFLNFLSTFSIFGTEMDSFIFKIVEFSLSLPYRLFYQYLFIDKYYIKELQIAYKKNNNLEPFLNNVVIVGHSLGGGLSKILARIKKVQSISLSGPGINAFHTRWTEEGNSENFDLSFIDLVPDMDLIPRVEESGGTIYRIICKKGPFSCHKKTLSLCEALAMCRNPYYDFYCDKVAGLHHNEIEEIIKDSDLQKKKQN